MINGKAEIKFGNGSVMVTPLCNNHATPEQVGAVCFNNAEPGEINRKIPIVDQKISEEASVIMTFSKTESIDVVIEALLWLKQTMDNETPETDQIGWDKPFNLDIMKEEEKEPLSEITRYANIILAAPSAKKVEIRTFPTKKEAELKAKRWTSWPYKVIVKSRDENGRFAKGYVLICCK